VFVTPERDGNNLPPITLLLETDRRVVVLSSDDVLP
jgi:hypothetical protein